MRSSYDMLRSLKRYFSLALPGYNVIFDAEEILKRPGIVITESAPATDDALDVRYANLIATYTIYVYPEPGANPQDSREKAARVQEKVEQLLGAGLAFDEKAEAWARADNGIGRRLLVPLYDFDEKGWKDGGIQGYAETRVDGDAELPQEELGVLDAGTFSEAGVVYVGTGVNEQALTYTGKNDTMLLGVVGGQGHIPDSSPVRQYGDRARPDYGRIKDLSVHVVQSIDDQKLYTVLAEVRMGWRRGSDLPSNAEMAESIRISFE